MWPTLHINMVLKISVDNNKEKLKEKQSHTKHKKFHASLKSRGLHHRIHSKLGSLSQKIVYHTMQDRLLI